MLLITADTLCCYRQDPNYCLSESAVDWLRLDSPEFRIQFDNAQKLMEATYTKSDLNKLWEVYRATVQSSVCGAGTANLSPLENGCGHFLYPGFCTKLKEPFVGDPLSETEITKNNAVITGAAIEALETLQKAPAYKRVFDSIVRLDNTLRSGFAGTHNVGSEPAWQLGSTLGSSQAVDVWAMIPGSTSCTFVTSSNMKPVGLLMGLGVWMQVLFSIWGQFKVDKLSKVVPDGD
jgi:hypothetical protein